MSLKEIVSEAISLVKEKRQTRRKLEKAHSAVVEALASGNSKALVKAIGDFAALIGKDRKFVRETTESLVGLKVGDRGIAKSLWLSILERNGVADELKKRFAAKEEAIRSKVTQLVLKGVFGGVSTKEDEVVAKERLAKALEEAKTIEDVVNACKTYIMVRANRLAQQSKAFDPEIAKATEAEIRTALRRGYEMELRKEIAERLAKGKVDAVTKQLFAYWLKTHKASDLTDKLYPILAKTRDFELVCAAVRRMRGGK